MISGMINVYKERGYTSHDVVAKLRGILRQKKIGHTGTLDPDAEGVLVVCLGSGTKLCDMLTDMGKTYQATLLLGKATDTQDISGTVLAERPVDVTESEAAECLKSFVGGYDQIPPMYSARKVNGKKLYELARAGTEIERKAQHVLIGDIQIDRMELPEVVFTVSCSKGTYIRTLCHDAGEKLGCGGCMKTLKRTRVGQFSIDDSRKLNEIEKLREKGQLSGAVYSVDSMFPELMQAHILPELEKFLRNGNPLRRDQIRENPDPDRDFRLRMYDASGRFCGIYGWDGRMRFYKPIKMFLGDE